MGNDAGQDLNGDGLRVGDAMLLGVLPAGPPVSPLDLVRPGDSGPVDLAVMLSDRALGRGVVAEASADLADWLVLWSFDADPKFASPHIARLENRGHREWEVRLADPDALPVSARFYRLRWTPRL